MSNQKSLYDTIIIGAGMGGMTAAIYASRKKMKYKIISKDVGGQFLTSGEVLNYPGIKETTGVDFAMTMQDQLKFNNINVELETLQQIEKVKDNFIVKTDKNEYTTRTVVLAIGAKPRQLNVSGEKEFAKKGVTYCAICDGPLYKDKDVAIIGGGSSALESVDFLDSIASKIYLIVRDGKLKAHEYLIESVENNPKVEIIYKADMTEIYGDKFVEGLKYKQKGQEKEIKVRGIFIEIGRIPNTDMVKDMLTLDEYKGIIVDCFMNTSVPGIFAAGDCTANNEHQYVIAAGQGCMALIKAARYLAGN